MKFTSLSLLSLNNKPNSNWNCLVSNKAIKFEKHPDSYYARKNNIFFVKYPLFKKETKEISFQQILRLKRS